MPWCKICKEIGIEFFWIDKRPAQNHFINEHPEEVRRHLERVDVEDRHNIRNPERWAAGMAAFVNSKDQTYIGI